MRRTPLLAILPVIVSLLAPFATRQAEAQYFRFGKNKVHYQDREWFFVQSDHFTVYFYEGGQYIADYTAKEAERAYAQISRLFQYRIANPIPLIVYLNHGDFAVTNAVDLPTYSESIGGVTELFKNRIAIPFTGDYQEYRNVVHHEIVHAVINDIYYGGSLQAVIQNNIQTQIPPWFNEGLAEYAAQGWDTESDMYIREAILGNHLAPIQKLSGYYAYRGGQSVWDYVAEQYGPEKVGEVLQRLRLSRSVDGAFQRATGLTVEDLSERWQQSLREIYFPEVAARENMDDVARLIVSREHGYYNTSPALSPMGDKLAFITSTSGLFDIYLVSANDGTVIRRLVEGQTTSAFESLRILTPGIAWSPDGTQIAVAVKRGPTDVIALIDVENGDASHVAVQGVEQIFSLDWSRDGSRIVFEGAHHAQTDIYLLTLESGELVNLTDDIFSDHEPAFSPDGTQIAFHSDRGSHVELGLASPETFALAEYDALGHDLYTLRIGADRARRLTNDPEWDERSGQFSPEGDRVLFISDRNGTLNLYEFDLESDRERPLTDLVVGVTQASLSADGRRAALVSLKDGTPSIYILRNPFERRLEHDRLRPSVWAQRVGVSTTETAPALALATSQLRDKNPYLRDILDGERYARGRDRLNARSFDIDRLSALIAEGRFNREANDGSASGSNGSTGTNGSNGTNGSQGALPVGSSGGTSVVGISAADDSTLSSGRVDFRNYRFSTAFEAAAPEQNPIAQYLPQQPPERSRLDANGNYVPRKYKLDFSPDIVYGAAGYDALYGVQGVTQMMFSDMLGDHRIIVATNLLIDLRNSDYVISYNYLPRRVDWTFSTFHLSRLLADFESTTPTYYRYRQYGANVEASFPLDKFRRLDMALGMLGVSQADITDVTRPSVTRVLLNPNITYTRDATTPGYMYPISGTRLAVSVSGSPLSFTKEQIRFLTVLGDARKYFNVARGDYVFAVRASAGASVGPNRQLFYTSGVQNWINRRFDQINGFPINDVTDFIFATPILPLRGFSINSGNGSSFGLVNAEFRFPLVAALLPGPLPVIPFYNVQGQAFIDAGAVWGGRGINPNFNLTSTDEDGRRLLDDLLIGTGFGIRTIFLGYPVRLDFAWPFDGHSFGDRKTYISIGLDF